MDTHTQTHTTHPGLHDSPFTRNALFRPYPSSQTVVESCSPAVSFEAAIRGDGVLCILQIRIAAPGPFNPEPSLARLSARMSLTSYPTY